MGYSSPRTICHLSRRITPFVVVDSGVEHDDSSPRPLSGSRNQPLFMLSVRQRTMKPRWVYDIPTPNDPVLSATIIAKWWFGRYFLVSTISLASLYDGKWPHEPGEEEPPYATQVFRCDKHGIVSDAAMASPLLSIKHPSLEKAQLHHMMIVKLYSQ